MPDVGLAMKRGRHLWKNSFLSGGGRGFRSSLPDDLAPFREYSDGIVLSTSVLSDDRAVTNIFVPHGQRHISETTHRLLGVAYAKMIQAHLGLLPPSGKEFGP